MSDLTTGVRELPSGRFNARITIDGVEYSETFHTREEAVGWRALTKREVAAGREAPKPPGSNPAPPAVSAGSPNLVVTRATVGEIAERWLEHHTRRGKQAPATVDEYWRLMRTHLMPTLGSIPIAELTYDHGEEYENYLIDVVGYGRSSVNRCFWLLSASMEYAKKNRYVDLNPFVDYDVAGDIGADLKMIDIDRSFAVARTLEAEWRLPFWFQRGLGLRRGEAWGVRLGAIDGDGFLHVRCQRGSTKYTYRDEDGNPQAAYSVDRAKTEAGYRGIFIPDFIRELIDWQIDYFFRSVGIELTPETFLCVTPRRRESSGGYGKRIVRAHAEAGLVDEAGRPMPSRALRVAFATDLATAGVPFVTRSVIMGHAIDTKGDGGSPVTDKSYTATPTPKRIREAMETFMDLYDKEVGFSLMQSPLPPGYSDDEWMAVDQAGVELGLGEWMIHKLANEGRLERQVATAAWSHATTVISRASVEAEKQRRAAIVKWTELLDTFDMTRTKLGAVLDAHGFELRDERIGTAKRWITTDEYAELVTTRDKAERFAAQHHRLSEARHELGGVSNDYLYRRIEQGELHEVVPDPRVAAMLAGADPARWVTSDSVRTLARQRGARQPDWYDPHRWLTVTQAANRLGTTSRQVHVLVGDGTLERRKGSKSRSFISVASIEHWEENRYASRGSTVSVTGSAPRDSDVPH